MYRGIGNLGKAWFAGATASLCFFQPVPSAQAVSIVLGEIEYTTDGGVDEEARSTVQKYLIFSLSRLQSSKPQSLSEYIRACVSGDGPKESDGTCALPDIFIQVQITERQEEVQISGAVSRKIDSGNLQSSSLDSIRIRSQALTDGLSSVVKNIGAAMTRSGPPPVRVPVIVACIVQPDTRDRPRTQTHQQVPASAAEPDLTESLPEQLEWILREQPGIEVVTKKSLDKECDSVEGAQKIAEEAKGQAVLTGRVYSDDRGGVIVRPQLFVVGGNRSINLPVIAVRRGSKAGLDVRDTQKLAATVGALLGSFRRDELVKALIEGTELFIYLDQAEKSLSSVPPRYETADALLNLAIWIAPSDRQAYLKLGTSLMERRQYKQAAEILQAGIKLVPEHNAALHLKLAENAMRARQLTEARRVYEDAVSANILGEEAWLGIASTYLAERPPDRTKAMEYALKAINAKNSVAADAYSLAGKIASANGNFVSAEEFFKRGRALAPNSRELAAELSGLYDRLAAEATRKGSPVEAVEFLTKAIDVAPSMTKYYDRAVQYFKVYGKSGERAKGYELSAADYKAALEIARREEAILEQFPWLMPNLIETLIFQGKFLEAKKLTRELFEVLGSSMAVRPNTDLKDIHMIAAFLNAVAELLQSGTAEKEAYLLEHAKIGSEKRRSSWSFADMEAFLADIYPTMETEPHLDPLEKQLRAAGVRQLIGQLATK